MASKIKKDDKVIILAGKDKGRRGTVTKMVLNVDGMAMRVFVEGVNMIKKHTRPNPQAQQPGGIIEKEASIHVSNVAIYNPVSQKADRVGFKEVNGKKVRVFRSNNEQIDV